MSETTVEPGGEQQDDQPEEEGVEIGMSEGEGSTFEPEEDPEAVADED